jgi:hypothetical protein
MNARDHVPHFEDFFPDLDRFLLGLVRSYQAGTISSWEILQQNVEGFFTPDRMSYMESMLPGWQKMSSYSGGITLTHVICVFTGMLMLPEFQSLTSEQKQFARWIVLFHDLDKVHIKGQKDTMHAFRSGIRAANLLPALGFQITANYEEQIVSWSEYTQQAYIVREGASAPTPDNQKLPQILQGIDALFGKNSAGAFITKTVLLHISLAVDPFYPTPAPLTEAEIKQHIDPALLPLLRVMMLSDNEGWSLFEPETRARQRRDTLQAFERVEKILCS